MNNRNLNEQKKKLESEKNRFLKLTGEDESMNQYWFSEKTIEFLVKQVEKHGKKVAFVSTPSIFFSVSKEFQDNCYLFDYDKAFMKKHKNALFFDFNDFTDIPPDNTFDFIVVDPPFITEDAWTKYSNFVKQIAIKNDKDEITSKILVSSISENDKMLKKLLNLTPRKYKPSIPHLVYQYNFFSNYEDDNLDQLNSEIIE